MKASHAFTVETEEAIVRIYVWGTCNYSYEASNWMYPEEESFEVLTLEGCEVEYEKLPDEAMLSSPVAIRTFTLDFEIPDQVGIMAYCKAWGINPFNMSPENIDEDDEPYGPDPDDQRDRILEQSGE